MSTEDTAMARLSFGLAQPTAGEAADRARVQQDIDRTMGEVIATASYCPVKRDPMPTVRVAGAGRVSDGVPLAMPQYNPGGGWAGPRPIELPPGQDIIERMVNAALPHGPKPKAEPPKADPKADGAGGGER